MANVQMLFMREVEGVGLFSDEIEFGELLSFIEIDCETVNKLIFLKTYDLHFFFIFRDIILEGKGGNKMLVHLIIKIFEF